MVIPRSLIALLLACAAVSAIHVRPRVVRTMNGNSPPAGGKYPPYCGIRPWAGEPAHPIPPPTAPAGVDLDLVDVNMVIRHGDRLTTHYSKPCWANNDAVWNCTLTYLETPGTNKDPSEDLNGIYRKNYLPNRNLFKGNCGMGQLTEYGYLQHVSNGEMLRNYYVTKLGFLPATYDPTLFFIRSDDEFRTVQSAQSLFLGFYPSETRTTANGGVNVVDMWTMDKQYDDMAPNANLCPLYQQYQNELVQSPAYKAHNQSVTAPLIAKIKSIVDIPGDFDMVGFNDCLNTHVCHDFAWPAGVNDTLYNEVLTEATWEWQQQFSYPTPQENSAAGIGFLLKEVLTPISSDSTVKFRLFSGHDNTLMPILASLGVWQGPEGWAPYASWIVFEHYRDSNNAEYMRMVYNGKEIVLPPCNGVALCPYQTFMDYVTPRFGNASACGQTNPHAFGYSA